MKAKRIGCYARVSHEEQKKFGFSINAQIEKLEKWCETEGHQLVEIYIDEGFTAGNMKRPGLKQMLNDLKNFDAIVFTRLDRFSRNVLEANKMLELLEENNVALISIEEEDIDTSTADGKFMFQLKVSLAERELKKGSERIKSVFDYKVKEGQPITGSLPMGYKIETSPNGTKKIAIDENYKEIVEDLFNHFAKYHSIRATMEHINSNYNISRGYIAYNRILKNPLYTGLYKGNENYAPAYITQKQYIRNAELIRKNVRKRKSKNVYLFSALIKCPRCGGAMCGYYTRDKRYDRTYYSYRCNRVYIHKTCDFNKTINETYIGEYLIQNIDRLVDNHITEVLSVKPIVKKTDPQVRIKEILDEMDNLNYIFKKKRIDVKEYDLQYEELELELANLQKEVPKEEDITILKEFLNSGWKDIYESLNRENKRALWRNLIKEIIIDEDFNITIVFL